MPKPPAIPRVEDLDEALEALVSVRVARAAVVNHITALKEKQASLERRLADLNKDIAARAAALRTAHAKGDFFAWAAEPSA